MDDDSAKTFDELSAIKGFKMFHLNVRSIVKKIDQIRILLQKTTMDIFTFSETWLKPHLYSALFNIDGYTLHRQDRAVKTKSGRRGGGLLTYVKNFI